MHDLPGIKNDVIDFAKEWHVGIWYKIMLYFQYKKYYRIRAFRFPILYFTKLSKLKYTYLLFHATISDAISSNSQTIQLHEIAHSYPINEKCMYMLMLHKSSIRHQQSCIRSTPPKSFTILLTRTNSANSRMIKPRMYVRHSIMYEKAAFC